MQNDVLYNKVMNKVLLFTLKLEYTDPDDPDTATVTLENASMKPSQLMTLKPPFFTMVYLHNADGIFLEYTLGTFIVVEESAITVLAGEGSIIGNLVTDTWELQ